jgi:hypothetical protein
MPQPTDPGPAISKLWCSYFLANCLDPRELPWDDPYILTPAERRAIAKSIAQFQLGEGAEGRRLQDRGRKYAAEVDDAHFLQALSLFIKEEQRHSADLGRFMDAQGIPRLPNHWVDSVFRRIRVLAGLELCLRVLVSAEIIAVPYYRALGSATASGLLHAISSRIFHDEAAHLKFQSSMLSRLAKRRSSMPARVVWRLHRIFLVGACFLVWAEHAKVFRAAGYCFEDFALEALYEFANLKRGSSVRSLGRSLAAVESM